MNSPKTLVVAALLTGLVVGGPTGALGDTRGRLGLQGLAVSNELTGELPDEGSWKALIGFGVGLVAELDLGTTVSLSFQPTLTPRNSRQEFKIFNQVVDHIDYDLTYLSLPLIVRVTGNPEGVRGFVTGGMDLGILIDATATGTTTSSEDIKDDLNPTSLGALFGAGVMVPVSRHFLSFELRYVQGLDDIVNREDSGTETSFTSPSVKYRGLELIVGFLFGLGGE